METLDEYLDQLKFWDMVEKYDSNNDLILTFPTPTDKIWNHIHEATRIRQYIAENTKKIDKSTLQPKIEQYRLHMKKLIEFFARNQGYQLKYVGNRLYNFKNMNNVSFHKNVRNRNTSPRSRSHSRSRSRSPRSEDVTSSSNKDMILPVTYVTSSSDKDITSPIKNSPRSEDVTSSSNKDITPPSQLPVKEHAKRIHKSRPYTKYSRRKNLCKPKSSISSNSFEASDFEKTLKKLLEMEDSSTTLM